MRRGLALVLLLMAWSAASASAHELPADKLRTVGFRQHIGDALPLDLALRDENDRPVALRDYFGTRPVVLTLNYFHCENLCSLELQGLVSGLNGVPFVLGDQYTLITVSFDARETPAQAQTARSRALRGYIHPQAADGWHVLTTTDQSTIDALTQAVGFDYVYDPLEDDYAHPAGVVVLTPAGEISRYLYGLDFSATDLRLALVDAAAQRLGTLVDRALLVCYHYDAIAGRYTPLVLDLLKGAGAATLLVVGAGLAWMWRLERRR